MLDEIANASRVADLSDESLLDAKGLH